MQEKKRFFFSLVFSVECLGKFIGERREARGWEKGVDKLMS